MSALRKFEMNMLMASNDLDEPLERGGTTTALRIGKLAFDECPVVGVAVPETSLEAHR